MVFVDLETSGANFANDRIIEVGLVEVDSNGVREWSVLVNPEMPLSPFITSLTGINEAMLRPAPTFARSPRNCSIACAGNSSSRTTPASIMVS